MLMGKHGYSIKDIHEGSGLSRNTMSSLYYRKVKRIDHDTVVKLRKTVSCDVGASLLFRSDNEDDGNANKIIPQEGE